MKRRSIKLTISLLSLITLGTVALSSCGEQYPFYEDIFEKYTVRFYQDGSCSVELAAVEVYEGQSAAYPSDLPLPVKEEDALGTYKFRSWSEDLSYVTSDLKVFPVYETTSKYYTVTLLDAEGNIYDTLPPVEAGTAADLSNVEPPVKEADEKYSYEFVKWVGGDYEYVIKDITLTPTYKKIAREYEVNFFVDDTLWGTYPATYGDTFKWPEDIETTVPSKDPLPTEDDLDTTTVFKFKEWNTKPDGSGENLRIHKIEGHTDFYAIFTKENTGKSNQKLIKEAIDKLSNYSENAFVSGGTTYKGGVIGSNGTNSTFKLGYNVVEDSMPKNRTTFALYNEESGTTINADEGEAERLTGTLKVSFKFDNDGLIPSSGEAIYTYSQEGGTKELKWNNFSVKVKSNGYFECEELLESSLDTIIKGDNLYNTTFYERVVSTINNSTNHSIYSYAEQFFNTKDFEKPY